MIPATPPRDNIEALADADQLVQDLGDTPGAITYRGVARPPWVDALIAKHNAMVRAGAGSDCPHLAGAPGVRHVASWALGRSFCLTCVQVDGMPSADPVEEHTCDVCRGHLPGRVTGAVFQLGTVLLLYGVCVDCRPSLRSSPAG